MRRTRPRTRSTEAPPASRSLDFFHTERAVEERAIRPVKHLRYIVQWTQPFGQSLRPPAEREHVPVRETASTTPTAENRFEGAVIVVDRHVLEEIAQIEAIDLAGIGLLEELLDGQAVPLQPVEVRADRVEVLFAQGTRQGVGVRAGENPMHVGIRRRILLPQRIPGPLQD